MNSINSEPVKRSLLGQGLKERGRPRVHAERGNRGGGPGQVEAIWQQRIIVGVAPAEDGSLFGLDGGEGRIRTYGPSGQQPFGRSNSRSRTSPYPLS